MTRAAISCAQGSSSLTTTQEVVAAQVGRSRNSRNRSSNAWARLSADSIPAPPPRLDLVHLPDSSSTCAEPASSRPGPSARNSLVQRGSTSSRNDVSSCGSSLRMRHTSSYWRARLRVLHLACEQYARGYVVTETSTCPRRCRLDAVEIELEVATSPCGNCTSTSSSGLMLLMRFSLARSPQKSLMYLSAVSSVFCGTAAQRSSKPRPSNCSRRAASRGGRACLTDAVSLSSGRVPPGPCRGCRAFAPVLSRGAFVAQLEPWK